MKTYHKCFNPLTSFLIMLLMLCLSAAPCLSATPGWNNVPKLLKQGQGVEILNDFVYATGASCIENIRPDKAHEMAKKKSLLRALQLASLSGSCKVENPGWSKKDQLHFYLIFSPLAKKIEFNEIQVIRQWEKKDCNYTTIAVPKQEVEKIPCEFSDIKTAVSRYLEYGHYTDSGLLFCLKNTDPYSLLRRQVETALANLLIENGEIAGLCFSNKQNQEDDQKLIKTVSIQNRLHRANKLVDLIKLDLSQKDDLTNSQNWEDSLVQLVSAVKLAPENGKAYLQIADWANSFYDPIVAIYASERAMRDGIWLKEALTRKVSYLKKIRSDEKEVFELLLSQCVRVPDDWLIVCWSEAWPESWNKALRIMKNNPVANIVAASLGQSIRSEPMQPPAKFARAVSLYNKSDSNDDLAQVLKILFKACEKESAAPEVYNLIGACFRHMGQYEIALPFLWQALVLKPGYDLALTNLGLCCEKLNLMKSAAFYYHHDAVVNSTNKWVNSTYSKFILKGEK